MMSVLSLLNCLDLKLAYYSMELPTMPGEATPRELLMQTHRMQQYRMQMSLVTVVITLVQ